jgi:beta-glucosidase
MVTRRSLFMLNKKQRLEKANEILEHLSLEQKVAQMQCMFVGGRIPSALLHRFPYGSGEIATVTSSNNKGQNIEEAKEQQTIILENCGVPAPRHVEALRKLGFPKNIPGFN